MSARLLLNTRPHLEAPEAGAGPGLDASRLPGGPYAQVIDCPLNGIGPADEDELVAAAAWINRAHVLVLVSPNATQAYAELAAAGRIARAPEHIAVMGPSSSARLQGVSHASRVRVSASHDALGLLPELLELTRHGELTVIGRAQAGKDALPDALREHGRSVQCVTLYHREALPWPPERQAQVEAALLAQRAAVLLTTASAPAEFAQRLSAAARAALQAAPALCTHPNVERAAAAAGFADVRAVTGSH
ncbi:hypothetical protein IP84_07720 [beta proteobacterium AAP99]|nr:hypothetical protein IP84_07720 [beta proteobacterium AAP99]